MILLIFNQRSAQTHISDALMLNNNDQECISYLDEFDMIIYKSTQNIHHVMLRHFNFNIVVDVADYLLDRFNYTKILFVNKGLEPGIIPNDRIKPNYYIIQTTPQLEECLGVEIEANRRNRIIRFHLPLALRVNFYNFIENEPFIVAREEPEEPVRVSMKRTWTDRLNAMTTDDKEIENEISECVVCLDNDPTIMLAPCMHQCICTTCIVEIMEREDQAKKCPICRVVIEDIFKPIK